MFRVGVTIGVTLFCFCAKNPVATKDPEYKQYIQYTCAQKSYTIAKDINEVLHAEPASSYNQFRFGISVSEQSADTVFVVGATTDNSTLNLVFPREYKRGVYEMKRNNKDPHFKCSFSYATDSSSYYETPHAFNSTDSSSDAIGYCEITRFDSSARVIEGRFEFWVYKYTIDFSTSTVSPVNDSVYISDGSFRYCWTDSDVKNSYIPDMR